VPTKLVLLVHTDADVLAHVAAALRSAGYDVLEFANTLPAMNALDGVRPPDLLITRARYPAGSPTGLSLARLALLKCPHIKVVITGDPAKDEYAAGLGVFHPHPIDAPRLITTVGWLLAEDEKQQGTPK
jgi:DNA-binding NtrC family response regulator